MRAPRNYYLPEGVEPQTAPKRRRAATRKRQNPEAAIQRGILKLLKLSLPGAVVHHSRNSLDMTASRDARMIAQARAKADGMLVGFPDLVVIWGDAVGRLHVFAFEVKAPGGVVSEAQVWVGQRLEANGARWAVVRSVTDAEDCLREWRGAL